MNAVVTVQAAAPVWRAFLTIVCLVIVGCIGTSSNASGFDGNIQGVLDQEFTAPSDSEEAIWWRTLEWFNLQFGAPKVISYIDTLSEAGC